MEISREANVRDSFYVALVRSVIWAGLSTHAKSVYPILRVYVDPATNTGSPTLGVLSDGTGLSDDSVRKGINELIKQGLVAQWGWMGGRNVYSMIDQIPTRLKNPFFKEVKKVMNDKSFSESDKLRKIDEMMEKVD